MITAISLRQLASKKNCRKVDVKNTQTVWSEVHKQSIMCKYKLQVNGHALSKINCNSHCKVG